MNKMSIFSFFGKNKSATAVKNAIPPPDTKSRDCIQAVYDADGYGSMDVITGDKAMIPWSLTQRIDVSLVKSPGMVCFNFMAEFHSDRLTFDVEESGRFLLVMEHALGEFNLSHAKRALDALVLDGVGRTIYRSPYYPSDMLD